MVTIKEVAKHAKVSVATVSRVLNKQGYVQENTRKKVEDAIKALNYRPNNVARSLFKKQSKMIGYIVPDITNPFFPQLVRAVEDVTVKAGYTTFLCNSDDDINKELMYLEKMLENHIDGVIIVSNNIQLHHLEHLDLPIVALDRVFHESIPSVMVNNYDGARKAVNYLLQQGCKKIAHLKGPESIENSRMRQKAYEDVIAENGMQKIIGEGEYHLKDAEKAMTDLLTACSDIDGIFAGNDVMAVGALKAASRMGIKVPEELKLIGFDGIEWTETVSPEISTMAQPIYEMGKKAALMLFDLINEKELAENHVVFDAEMKIRETT